MGRQDYTTRVTVEQTPQQAVGAIANVRGWWSTGIEGDAAKVGNEFVHRYKDVHRCKIRVVEVAHTKVVWLVVENHFNFTRDKTEWVNTKIIFDIVPKGGKTEIRFTHQGLVPAYECFELCSNAWGSYIKGSLKNLIATGKGLPDDAE